MTPEMDREEMLQSHSQPVREAYRVLGDDRLTVAELADRMGVAKNTAYSRLQALLASGLVDRDEGQGKVAHQYFRSYLEDFEVDHE